MTREDDSTGAPVSFGEHVLGFVLLLVAIALGAGALFCAGMAYDRLRERFTVHELLGALLAGLFVGVVWQAAPEFLRWLRKRWASR